MGLNPKLQCDAEKGEPYAQALEVQDVQNGHDVLLSTLKQVRALHATLSVLMTDVAAIRRNPAARARGSRALQEQSALGKPIVEQAMESYHEMIRQIEESELWRN